ncbi:MAG: hypothetical protein CMI02_06455 [Oceanospirillaceae bacterium]|nr:hypothetical protein [Oceanospirillaceae bacterium]MBT11657.1 hypothetical protein [Oceanospirillaceae bacterium]|tara:strand:+ start:5070 stop:5441 length:372 start_codon:yes stop_codon:yes gene_type:complete
MHEALPLPATDQEAEMAFLFPSGRSSRLPCLVYETARDFLSAPRQYCLLEFDADAWLTSASDPGEALEYGLHTEAGEEGLTRLIFNWPDRCVEVICQQVSVLMQTSHEASAMDVIGLWLQSGK